MMTFVNSSSPFRGNRTEMMKCLVLVVCLLGYVAAIPVDNGVEGDPEIECGPTTITINFNTQQAFQGHTYVKGRFAEPACKRDPSNRQVASIDLPFDTCGVQRERSLTPKGVFVRTTVIISFHPLFETKVDRAYTIQCFYMEADKTVSTEIEVSMLTTGFQSQLVPMPVCKYEILRGGPTGEVVQFALVGDQVYHKWTCDSDHPDTFCMTVHTCYVDDGQGDRVDLVGPDGCALDRYLINNLEYPSDLMGGVEAHVFKYADRTQLYFTCQITILVKEPNAECIRPTCQQPEGRGGRKRRQVEGDNVLDVSCGINTLDIEDNASELPQSHRVAAPRLGYEPVRVERRSEGVCLSATGFATFLVISVALIAAVVVVSSAMLFRRSDKS